MAVKLVPWWLWLVLGIVIILGLVVAYERLTEKYVAQGRAEIQASWDKERVRVEKEIERIKKEQKTVTTVTETVYVDKVKVVHEKGEVRYKEIPVYVRDDACPIDGGFRVYHDAAATDRVPDPAEVPNAAPTTLREVATTVNSNYTKCHVAYATVQSWQDWATEQCKLNDKGCPYE